MNTAFETYGTASSIQHTFSGNIRGKEMSIKKQEETRAPNFSYLMKNYYCKNLQSSTNFEKDKHKEIYTKTYHNQIMKAKDKQKNLKGTREKGLITYKGASI